MRACIDGRVVELDGAVGPGAGRLGGKSEKPKDDEKTRSPR